VQVDPNEPTLKPPENKHLKLKYDEVLSSFGFKFKLCRYNEGIEREFAARPSAAAVGPPEEGPDPATPVQLPLSGVEAGAYTRSLFSSTRAVPDKIHPTHPLVPPNTP
jgi:hypothetical protein